MGASDEAQVRQHRAAALRHAVDLGLLDEQPFLERAEAMIAETGRARPGRRRPRE